MEECFSYCESQKIMRRILHKDVHFPLYNMVAQELYARDWFVAGSYVRNFCNMFWKMLFSCAVMKVIVIQVAVQSNKIFAVDLKTILACFTKDHCTLNEWLCCAPLPMDADIGCLYFLEEDCVTDIKTLIWLKTTYGQNSNNLSLNNSVWF